MICMEMEELIQNKLRVIYNDNNLIFDKSHFVGGLTNYNYLMEIKGIQYVIREPGNMTHLMIDRDIEKVNNEIVSEIGISSECVYFDENSGMKISIYINKSNDIGQLNPNSPKNIEIVSDLMKKTHSSKKHFPNIFDWQEELEKYEGIIVKQNGSLFSDYAKLKDQLIEFMDTNIVNKISLPCHNDTVPENFLIDYDHRGYLIDWEYSGMNDPSWDIAGYIIESILNPEAIDYLLIDYYGEIPDSQELLKIKCYMMAQDLLWAIWAMIRHYTGEDFLDYCYMRYRRFKKNLKEVTNSLDYPIAEMVK